mmetsp:Transcript_41138/g.102331  ORF Transcript_41138/g.102331 Transcript_41138/m.102331 type:complete len:262 (+) Transcript_41138:671-1456(+)
MRACTNASNLRHALRNEPSSLVSATTVSPSTMRMRISSSTSSSTCHIREGVPIREDVCHVGEGPLLHALLHLLLLGAQLAALAIELGRHHAVRLLLLGHQRFGRLLEGIDPRLAGERRARERLHEAEEGLRVARRPIGLGQRGSDRRVVDDVPVALHEEGTRLVDGHLCEHVAVVVARGLVGEQVRHRQQRARGGAALDVELHLLGELQDGVSTQLIVRHLIQRLLEVRHRQHAAQREHLVRVRRAHICLDEGPRQALAGA